VIVTGAFGNVGKWVVKETCLKGYEVLAYDLKTDVTEKKQKTLSSQYNFQTVWGDLTDRDHVSQTIQDFSPEYIIHVAAVIAPTAYVIPRIAFDVNVKGSRYLIQAASQQENFKKFIFVSSYSVHGPRNPNTTTEKLTGDTPVNPQDNYGWHKVAIEQDLEKSDLEWTIIRLPAVFSVDADFGTGSEFLTFGFMLDPDRNEHAIDARDAGLALANAVEADTAGRKFDIGGDPEQGWSGKAKDLQGPLFRSKGLSPAPLHYYRRSDPEVDESWYFEDFVDTAHSQEILKYQRITFQEHFQHNLDNLGFKKYLMKILGPLIKRHIAGASYFKDTDEVDSRPVWEVVKEIFDLQPNEDLMIY
jgi:nucleoside-diphosphate-sugar epimerase